MHGERKRLETKLYLYSKDKRDENKKKENFSQSQKNILLPA